MAAQDFIQQLMGLVQLSLQQQEQQRLQAAQRGQMLAIFQNAARQTTNPTLVRALRSQFAPLTGMSEMDLEEIARHTVPQADVIRLDAATRGYANMQPDERALIDKTSMVTSYTGMTPQSVVEEATFTQLPRTDIQRAVRTKAGLEETEAQRLAREQNQWQFQAQTAQRATEFLTSMEEQYRQFDLNNNYRWATHRLGWADLMQRGILSALGLTINADKASKVDWNVNFADVVGVMKELGLARRALMENKGKMSREELTGLTNSINMYTQMLVDWGIEVGQPSEQPWVPPIPMGPRSGPRSTPAPVPTPAPTDTTLLGPRIPGAAPDTTGYNQQFSPFLPRLDTLGRQRPNYLRPEDLSMPSGIPFFDYFFRPGWRR